MDPFLRLTTSQIISQAHLQKTTNSFQANSLALLESRTKEGIQLNTKLKVNTDPNIHFLEEQVSKFKAGNIRNCYHEWERITSDSKILEIVRNGLSINFEYIPHKCSPHRYPRAFEEASVINNEI